MCNDDITHVFLTKPSTYYAIKFRCINSDLQIQLIKCFRILMLNKTTKVNIRRTNSEVSINDSIIEMFRINMRACIELITGTNEKWSLTRGSGIQFICITIR